MAQPESPRINPLPLAIAGMLIVVLFAASIAVYPELPARIPQHFGFDGRPDRWVERSLVAWLLLPIIALMVSGFVVVIASIIPRDLRLLNVPNKARLLALPAERQALVAVMVRNTLHWIVVMVLLMFAGLQLEVYLAAMSGAATELGWLVVVWVAGVLTMVIALNARLQRLLRETSA